MLCDLPGGFRTRLHQDGQEQNLSLNPTKISGICGRLMCCLKFETELYREEKREQDAQEEPEPKEGSWWRRR